MMRRSARIKAKQLMLEGKQGTVKVKVTEDASSRVVTAASEPNAGTQEYKTCSSSSSSLKILSAREEALQNPVILQHLFGLCPAPIVASCRLVCKQWYEESLAIWRTSFPFYVMLQNKDIFLGEHYFYNKRHPPIRPPLQEFLEFIDKPESQCSTKPYRSMELSSCRYSLNYEEFNLLWKTIGSNLTTLNLSCCKFSSIDDFRKVIFKCCPVLQRLNVIYCRFPRSQNPPRIEEISEVEYQEPLYGEHKFLRCLKMTAQLARKTFPVSWIELFSHFPWLTSFNVTLYGDVTAEFEILMKTIRVIRKTDKNKLPFKRFEFSPRLAISREPTSHRKFALIKELRLPLKNCLIRVHPKLDQCFVRSTLDDLATSLNSIEVYQGEIDEDGYYHPSRSKVEIPKWFIDFPFGVQLNNLTKLKFGGYSFGSFTILKYAPNLSKLEVSDPERRGWCTTTMKAVSNTYKEELANVKMLRLTTLDVGLLVSEEDLQQMFKWMPNIIDLSLISLNHGKFRMVCESWRNLRQLSVGLELMNDERVPGTKRGSKKKTKEFDYFDFFPGVVIEFAIILIADLECLYLYHGGDVTPEYVFNLFLHMPSLQT